MTPSFTFSISTICQPGHLSIESSLITMLTSKGAEKQWHCVESAVYSYIHLPISSGSKHAFNIIFNVCFTTCLTLNIFFPLCCLCLQMTFHSNLSPSPRVSISLFTDRQPFLLSLSLHLSLPLSSPSLH